MSQIHVHPDTVAIARQKVAAALTDMLNKQKSLKSHFDGLKISWNDASYQSVITEFEEYHKRIMSALQVAEAQIVPHMTAIEKAARIYWESQRK